MEKFKYLPIGIDLGTTFSSIGVYRNATVEIIPNEKGERTTPSIVSFLDDDIYVGEQTEYKQLKNPKNKIYAIKRIIGRNFNDKEVQKDIKNFSYKVENNNNRPQIIIDSNGIKKYSPEEISAKILGKLKRSAEVFLQQSIKKVVITVPAYFTERQKQATKNAGEIAGLDVIKIINEPTAASFAYGFGRCLNLEKKLLEKNIIFNSDSVQNNYINFKESNLINSKMGKKEMENILIFDLGGGTLDVTLLELEKDDITIKSHSGRMHLGGEDFDNILLQFCIEAFKKKTKIDLNKEKLIKEKIRLKNHCEKAKKELSYKTETEIEVESIVKGKDFYLKLTRAKFEHLCEDIFKKCKEPIKEVLKDSKENINNIDEIVLVGGSTRIPKIQSMLKEFFRKNVNNRLNPDETVAYGATIEAAILMGDYTEDITLLDVCPFSLGVAIEKTEYYDEYGLYMRKIINKGAKLPCKFSQIFHPAYDNSKSLKIQIYEGDFKYVKDNYPLGNFELLNIPKKKKDEIEILVTFDLDEDSILTVTALIEENNCTNSIVIKNDKGGLSKNEIENAKIKQKNEIIGENLGPAMSIERNYKSDINKLINIINRAINPIEQFYHLQDLRNNVEKFIDMMDINYYENDTFIEKMYYYLNILFNIYSLMLNYENLINLKEKENIIAKTKNYLRFFEKKGIRYCPSLVKIFYNNMDEIFGEFCIQILSYYFQKGKEFYTSNDKNYAKHFIEEALSINKKYSVEERVKNITDLYERLYSIIDNCNELRNKLKADLLEKYCKSFSKYNLIKEEELINNEQILDILDLLKEALKHLANPIKNSDILLKAIYLGNIIKIEYKIFNSNNYDIFLKMIENCMELEMKVKDEYPNLQWIDEIKRYKREIENKLMRIKENPKEEKIELKNEIKNILEKINKKFKEGKIKFFFYILYEHEPNGLDENMIFKNEKDLEYAYNSDKKGFLKKIRKLYNPTRYRGDKKENRIKYSIMHEISTKLNSLN